MRLSLLSLSLILLSTPPARARSGPVCGVFTDGEIADVLGKPATVKRSMLGPDTDCLWSVPGLALNVTRTTDADPQVAKAIVDSRAKNSDKDVVTPEQGIGDQALSVQGQYGRSVALAFRSGTSAWIMNLETADQKLDVASALPKLRALAKKAAAPR